jgi:tripartite-type tricarboxylate transporter receptor subunit TctC
MSAPPAYARSSWRAGLGLLAFVALCSSPQAQTTTAQNWPDRSIKFVVPQPPGGGFDTMARLMADRLQLQLGQSIVVENRTGAGTRAGTDYVAKAVPDGYTWLFGGLSNIALNVGLYKDLPYDPLTDFKPVGLAMMGSYTLVTRNEAPQQTFAQVIAFAKANPGKLTYASAGKGSGQHIAMAVSEGLSGVRMVHVPYRGAQAAYQDVMAGRVDLFFDSTATAKALVEGKAVHGLAVSSRKRLPALPDLPTLRETGVIDFSMESWSGIFLPSKTPEPVVVRMRQEMAKMMADPAMQERIRGIGQEPLQLSPDETEQFVKTEVMRWSKQLRDIGLTE